jgi:hypothetical protein
VPRELESGAFPLDEKCRVARPRRIIEGYHQVVLTIIAGQPSKARGAGCCRDTTPPCDLRCLLRAVGFDGVYVTYWNTALFS